MKKILVAALAAMLILTAAVLTGCGSSGTEASASDAGSAPASASGLEDGTYVVDFTTDHMMFHVNDAHHDKGILTVKDGQMMVHVSLQSKKIVNLFLGNKEDAEKEGAELIEPTKDKIVYDDGIEEEVYGFDIPVPALDEPYEVSIIGTHGNWYTHQVTVSNPVPGNEIPKEASVDLEDGEYDINIELEGGTGKASIESPAKMVVKDGKATATVIWSSEYYDYMLVNGEKYEPVNTEGNSTFEIPVLSIDEPFEVIADTTAMSQPHEIEYKLTCTLAEE